MLFDSWAFGAVVETDKDGEFAAAIQRSRDHDVYVYYLDPLSTWHTAMLSHSNGGRSSEVRSQTDLTALTVTYSWRTPILAHYCTVLYVTADPLYPS